MASVLRHNKPESVPFQQYPASLLAAPHGSLSSPSPDSTPRLPPLRHDGSEIRLLEVHPDLVFGMVQCTVRTYASSSGLPRPKYTALSYAWHQPAKGYNQWILLNGNRCWVGQNLASFLKKLVDPGELQLEVEKHLWIDALCIDQSDDAEKSQQVAIMANIYRNASAVCVWLGDDDRDWKLILFEYPKATSYHGNGSAYTDARLQRMLSNPYFERLWVVQEVKLATRLVIACGSLVVTESRLKVWAPQVLACLKQHGMRGDWFFNESLLISGSSLGEELIEHGLNATSRQECTDIRDKVYAIRNLVRDGDAIVPDYSLTPHELYLAVVGDRMYSELAQGNRALWFNQHLEEAVARALNLPRVDRLPYDDHPLQFHRKDAIIQYFVSQGRECSTDDVPKSGGAVGRPPSLACLDSCRNSTYKNSLDLPNSKHPRRVLDAMGIGAGDWEQHEVTITGLRFGSIATYRAKFSSEREIGVGSMLCTFGDSTDLFVILRPSSYGAMAVGQATSYDNSLGQKSRLSSTLGGNAVFDRGNQTAVDDRTSTSEPRLSYTLTGFAVLQAGSLTTSDEVRMSSTKTKLYSSFIGEHVQVFLDREEALQLSLSKLCDC